jgi:hypothetical protein
VQIAGANGSASAGGLAALTRIANADATDALVVNGLGGDDVLSAPNLAASALSLALNGGSGNDTLLGGAGDRQAVRRLGQRRHRRQPGQRHRSPRRGDDSFIWDPGDGSDVVEGGDGFRHDGLQRRGRGRDLRRSANGGRLRFFRQPGNILMDTDDTERVVLRALGGADATT